MQIIKYLSILILIILSNDRPVYAQNNISDLQAIQMLRDFYTVYNNAWSTTHGYVLVKKIDSIRDIYCASSLRKELAKSYLDNDILIGDEYTDAEHLETLIVSKDPKTTNGYIVFYKAPSTTPRGVPIIEDIILHVTVLQEDGKIKIASVK